jgi:hypothetical protein
MRLFEEDMGYPVTKPEQLEEWVASPRGKLIIELKAKLVRKKNHSRN